MAKQAQKLEQARIDDLIPYARNSRTHSEAQVAQVAASIREFGFTNPVLIDADGGIIAGHGRVLAARKLGMDTVPAIRIDYMTEAQKRAYVIADNKLALNAGWDDELLALELGDLNDEGFDLSLTGFSEDELARLVIDAEETGMPDLASGDREPLQQMAFMLHDDQAETVRAALDVAKQMGAFVDTGNENSNGNALARVCELFLGQHGNS
ncbi:hypothetical protein B9Z43_01330 [Limnohabitans sp. MMS-10A-192]|uniref:ParB/Srx family N-terminal domain-containing protein n=1 Tax=Limnohabitans sp. MMS-10A-192 TaxID=1835769 RepID=UPI000D369A46|nr:hypothetical protein B9Z43_01330 [Limnohabitans sp. MMS-10A-192]